MIRYAVVLENAGKNWSAYSPDVPGCVATGATAEECRRLMIEALEFHLEGMAEDGESPPDPSAVVEYVEVREPTPTPQAKSKPQRRTRAG